MWEHKVNNVGELTNFVEKLTADTRRGYWYRGQADSTWDLLPAVRRGYTPQRERYLTHGFVPRAVIRHHNSPNIDDYAGWISLMQHYGVPTRLLDWSRSPLIACFFAVEEYMPHGSVSMLTGEARDVDACIWAIAPSELNKDQGFEEITYSLNLRTVRPLIKPAFKEARETGQVIAATAVEIDGRMQMQQGAFTVHGSAMPLNRIVNHEQWLARFIIPSASRQRMADELKTLGFRLGDLFPDLVSLARELKARHKPRP